MRQNIPESQKNSPGGVAGKSSSQGAHADSDFLMIDLRLERSVFEAKGETLTEQFIVDLELAKAKLYKSPCPPSVRLDDVPGLGPIHLCHNNHDLYGLTVGGMRVELVLRRDEAELSIHSGGPYPLDEERLVELENKAGRIKAYFLGEESWIEPGSCSVVLYCHCSPDPSDTLSRSNTFLDFQDGRITPASGVWARPRGPITSREPINCLFSSEDDGQQVRLCSFGQGVPLPYEGIAYTGLTEKPCYREDQNILCVDLTFNRSFIRRIMRSIGVMGTDPNYPSLLRLLVLETLGDASLPHSFFRVATLESSNLPEDSRPNSAAWESVRRTFLEAMRGWGQKEYRDRVGRS